jgi:hypothetical protein
MRTLLWFGCGLLLGGVVVGQALLLRREHQRYRALQDQYRPYQTGMWVQFDTTQALGVTQCRDDDVVVWVVRPTPGARWNVDVAHEMTHVRQCFEHTPAWWDSVQSDPEGEQALEREAWCVDSLVAGLVSPRCAGVRLP